MPEEKPDLARDIAKKHYAAGDPLGWFDDLYQTAARDISAIPWADRGANKHLIDWSRQESLPRPGQRVLVTGCGLGDDAEFLASQGAQVTAFDLSETAIKWCHERFPDTKVDYHTGNLLTYRGDFDWVIENYTLQALPADLREKALANLATLGREILVICRGRDESDPPGQLPWPLTRQDLAPLLQAGFEIVKFDDFDDPYEPGKRRFRIHYRRKS